MPKDEFDFADPLELNGMAFRSHEDTTNDMAECFTEEFMRMGYSHTQVLAVFRNPHYLGPNMAYEKRGEPFIRDLIGDVFARWGKVVTWPDPSDSRCGEMHSSKSEFDQSLVTSAATADMPDMEETLTDPMGSPIPKLNV
jgi:hypothetical protein